MNTDRQFNPQATADSIQRIASGLRTALRIVGLSNRACERELGLSTGCLSRILAGEVQLRVAHVLDLCQMLELPPAAFFSAPVPASQTSVTNARLLRGLAPYIPNLPPPPRASKTFSCNSAAWCKSLRLWSPIRPRQNHPLADSRLGSLISALLAANPMPQF